MKAWLPGAILLVVCFDARAQNSDLEKQINRRNKESNGIVIAGPKIFDDFLLQQMLSAAEARLASMQVLDAAGLASRLGAISGAQQTINSFAVSAQGAPLPAVSTVENGATGSTVNTTQSSGQTRTSTSQRTSGEAATNVTTNMPSFAAPAAAAPAATTSTAGSFGVSSLDVLNEQMQLVYEIANLRLLLEGAVSDRFSKGGESVKPRTTLGFSITLSPRYKDAVAIVEVQVTNKTDKEPEPPAITALLPREKTYNVASIRDSSVSIGGGAVTQVFGISGSFLHGSKSYYLVQDQDTVALQLQPAEQVQQHNTTAFLWQFRPVLGRHYLGAGIRQTFVQVAFSNSPLLASPGDVSITTYWCRYDLQKGVIGRVIPGSLRRQDATAIPRYNIAASQRPASFSRADLEDLGNGEMLVRIHGNFLTDTGVRVGSRMLTEGAGGLKLTQIGMEFTAPISDLATKAVMLVTRDGSEIPLVIPHEVRPGVSSDAPRIADLQLSAIDETKTLVSVRFTNDAYLDEDPPLVFILGDKVFGYSNAPFFPSKDGWRRAIVPTSLLLTNPTLVVKPLFAPARFAAQADLKLTPFGQSERVVLLEKKDDHSSFLLYGSRLADATLIAPEHVTLQEGPDKDTLRRFDLSAAQLKEISHIFIRRGNEYPVLIALPHGESGASSTGAEQKISISGTVSVKAEKRPLPGGKRPPPKR